MDGDRGRSRGCPRARALVRGVVVFFLAGVPSAGRAQQAAAAPLVFDRVTVVDVEQGKLVPEQRVVIVGPRIQRVGPTNKIRVPKGAQVVEARGQYLIPGLWDLHSHTNDHVSYTYPLLVANGVTGTRDAGSGVPLQTTLALWREILAGTRVGPPRQLLSGEPIRSGTPIRSGDTSAVAALKRAGANFIKLYDLSPDIFFPLLAETRRLGLPAGAHPQDTMDLTAASDSGLRIADHLSRWLAARCWGDSATVKRCQPVAEHFRRNGTWWVPTLIRGGATWNYSEITPGRYAKGVFDRAGVEGGAFLAGTVLNPFAPDQRLRDSIATVRLRVPAPGSLADSVGAMAIVQRVGLPIALGTDAASGHYYPEELPGFAVHTELAIYVAEGLTPLNALQAATLNPAKMLRGTDSLGTVAAGKLADLVLLDADPLADILHTRLIRAVVANGRYFDRAALDRLLAEGQTAVRAVRGAR